MVFKLFGRPLDSCWLHPTKLWNIHVEWKYTAKAVWITNQYFVDISFEKVLYHNTTLREHNCKEVALSLGVIGCVFPMCRTVQQGDGCFRHSFWLHTYRKRLIDWYSLFTLQIAPFPGIVITTDSKRTIWGGIPAIHLHSNFQKCTLCLCHKSFLLCLFGMKNMTFDDLSAGTFGSLFQQDSEGDRELVSPHLHSKI